MTLTAFDLAPGVSIGGDSLPFIAGPCVIEGEAETLDAARQIAAMAHRLGLPTIFKASFDKANRSSLKSYRGPGLEEGLRILDLVKSETGLPVLTDVHEATHCAAVAEVCDVLQIPAFLCRQTDLVVAAARTGRPVNIKKGQFMAPDGMRWAVDKATAVGNGRVTVTERGVSFGYGNLVVDMRSFSILQDMGIPVIFDVTHSLQLPSGAQGETAGERRFAEPLARAAVAAGASGIFMELHPSPDAARSDRSTQLTIERGEALAISLLEIRRTLAASVPLA